MAEKVLLLTGVPAAGKTTLALELKKIVSPLQVITFGEMILEVKKRTEPGATYEQLRRNPTKEANTDLIDKASDLLLERVGQLRRKTNILIDSHAVAKDEYGFRITPDSQSFLQKLSLDAILLLHTDHQEVAKRINQKAQGRRQVTPNEIATHEMLQASVAIAYSVATGCPVFVIEINAPAHVVAAKLLNIFDLIGMSYSRIRENHG